MNVLSGCGSTGTSGSTETDSASSAQSGADAASQTGWESVGEETATSQNTASNEVTGDGSDSGADEGSTEDAAENSTAVVLEEGEEALLQTGEVTIPFQGTVPDLAVNWDNTDNTVAWLIIPGTNINTGVLGSEAEGYVWIDENSMSDFTDPMTVLHGSSTDGGPLEQALDYADADFFSENPYVYIYRPDGEVLEYKVFASYEHEKEDILVEHNAFDYNEFSEYINDIFNQRSMTALTDETLKDSVIRSWQVLTIDCDQGSDTDFLIQATLTGEGTRQ